MIQCCRIAPPWDDPQCASMFHFEAFETVLALPGDASGRYVGEQQWTAHPRMIKARTMDGEWASKAAAAYPGKMNAAIARAITANTRRKRPAPVTEPTPGS